MLQLIHEYLFTSVRQKIQFISVSRNNQQNLTRTNFKSLLCLEIAHYADLFMSHCESRNNATKELCTVDVGEISNFIRIFSST